MNAVRHAQRLTILRRYTVTAAAQQQQQQQQTKVKRTSVNIRLNLPTLTLLRRALLLAHSVKLETTQSFVSTLIYTIIQYFVPIMLPYRLKINFRLSQKV